ncbi:MAG: histidine kinase [Mucilaginibacter sp.]|nr:histidine kinase [Mucilaginibacter sp.]
MRIHLYLPLLLIFLCLQSSFCQDISFRKITADNGLSHNTVYTIVQDQKGFMWFGTREGLNRFDSYTIKNYYLKNLRSGTSTNRISCLLSLKGSIYIGTDNGLYQYDEALDKIIEQPVLKDQFSILAIASADSSIYIGTNSGFYQVGTDGRAHLLADRDRAVTAISLLSDNRFLLATGSQLHITGRNGNILKTITTNTLKPDFTVFNIYHEKGTDWLCTNYGLYLLDEDAGKLSRIKFTSDESTESNTVRAITRTGGNKFIIGTENGLYIYDALQQQSVNYTQSFDNNPKKLNDKAIYSAYTAKDGSIWLGTYFGGINYIPSVSYGFKNVLASEQTGRLNGKAISQMMEDGRHNIWIGTEDGGIAIYNPKNQVFTNINRRSSPFHLDINNVHAIYDDGAGSIWVGTFLGGLHRFEQSSGKTSIYTNRAGDTSSLSNDQVYAVYRDSKNTLWVGTQHGLNIFDYKTGRFDLFKPGIFGTEFIYDMIEDSHGDLWFCTRWNGVLRYQAKNNKIIRYIASGRPYSLPGNQVISVYKDSRNVLWFGTLDGGACAYDATKDGFTVLNTQKGLPNNNVYGILEDGRHQLWFSTNRGLSCYNRNTRKFINYDNRYGLPSNQFNFKSFLKASDGMFYFGTIHGLCYFDPQNIKTGQQQVPVRFTGFQLFNKLIEPGNNSLLSKQIDDTENIYLEYAQNVFSIGFAAINYSNVRGNNYAYYLEGFEKKWANVSDKNLVTYTSLSPGKYIFHLRALDVSGSPVSKERVLIINVAPPFYLSKVAFVLYALLIGLAIWLYAQFIKFVHVKKLEVQLERVEKEKTAALIQHRLNFFTFISHEFKTPLTLIIASVEKFMGENNAHAAKSAELAVIKNNASRLFKMIQQLMEFRTIETDHSAVKLTRDDLVKFVKNTAATFQTLAQGKGLVLKTSASVSNYLCYFDADKVEKILFNIISNAIKNTTAGQISLELSFETTSNGENRVTIIVADTGKGMSKKELENIFHTFYKGINSDEGSGVGMALVKSLVTYLNGEIDIKSEPAVGTLVHINLPVTQTPAHLTEPVANEVEPVQIEIKRPAVVGDSEPGKHSHTLLIVEDNKELLVFLSKHLGRYYNIMPASNGQAGFNKLVKQTPDLVISDIKMPKMDGIELCKKIKSDTRYNYIPVVLLSDNTRENIKLDGLDVGADAYLAKPFNLKEMELLIANVIRSHVKLREQLLDMSKFGLNKLPRNNKDQEFLAKLAIVLETHFADPQFTVEEMAAKLCISRTLLHINLKKILDKSASQLLNEYRLKKALLMLKENLPINEVAYYCGYSDPNYFSRIFRKHYNISPGVFRSAPDNYREII